MSTTAFLIATLALAAGTYAIRLAGVWWGSRTTSGQGAAARTWIERATVVLILGVAAVAAAYDGQELASPSRMIGVAAGVGALLVKVPMLIAVVIAMGTCALLRAAGMA